MAQDLGISRNTVNAVYEQLKAEGFLQSRAGKGIFVHEDIKSAVNPSGPGLGKPGGVAMKLPPLPALPRGKSKPVEDASLPFQPGLPDLDAFPIRTWNRIMHHQESRRPLRGYDSILCENPGYRGARNALGRFGNPLIPIPLRNQVLDVKALPGLEPARARLLFCTPTHQYPMGGILDLSQRMALVQWAQRNECWIIEDDYDSEFHFYNKPFAAIQGLFENAPVLYMGSFSKTLLPALRVGYLVVPEAVVEPLLWAKQISGGETPLLTQATIAEFIESGQFTRHLRRMRQLYRDKWQLFQSEVTEKLGGLAQPVAESAGMHLVLEGGFDDLVLSE